MQYFDGMDKPVNSKILRLCFCRHSWRSHLYLRTVTWRGWEKNGVKFLDQSLGQGKKRRQHFWVRKETSPPCTARDWRWSRATTNRDCCMVSFNSRWCNSTSAMGLKYLISKITLLLLKWGVLLNPYLFCVADKDKCLQQLTYQQRWWFELHSITWHNYDE